MLRHHVVRRTACVALLGLLLSGCGAPAQVAIVASTRTPTPAPPTATSIPPTETPIPPTPTVLPTVAPDWDRYMLRTAGFVISLPRSWQKIDVDKAEWEAREAAVLKKFPDLPTMIEGQAREERHTDTKLRALDATELARQAGVYPELNLVKIPLVEEIPLERFIEWSQKRSDVLLDREYLVSHRMVEVGGREALEMQYDVSQAFPNNKYLRVRAMRYVWVKDKNAYVLTLAAPARLREQYEPMFEQIGETFHIVE